MMKIITNIDNNKLIYHNMMDNSNYQFAMLFPNPISLPYALLHKSDISQSV